MARRRLQQTRRRQQGQGSSKQQIRQRIVASWEEFNRGRTGTTRLPGTPAYNFLMHRLEPEVNKREIIVNFGAGADPITKHLKGRGRVVVSVDPGNIQIVPHRVRHMHTRIFAEEFRRKVPVADKVVCDYLLSFVPKREAIVRAAIRSLKPGGIGIFLMKHPKGRELADARTTFNQSRVFLKLLRGILSGSVKKSDIERASLTSDSKRIAENFFFLSNQREGKAFVRESIKETVEKIELLSFPWKHVFRDERKSIFQNLGEIRRFFEKQGFEILEAKQIGSEKGSLLEKRYETHDLAWAVVVRKPLKAG